MGTFCSTDKGADSDEHEKDPDGSLSHNSPGMKLLQHLPDKMVSNKSTTKSPNRQPPRGDRVTADFKFQNNVANVTNPEEAEANRVIVRMRQEDEHLFQQRSLSPGDHFSQICDLLEDTRLFHVAQMVPKGAHLHLHFNSTLKPEVLLGYAKQMNNMYLWSDLQLRTESDFRNCKIEFSLRNLEMVWDQIHAKATEDAWKVPGHILEPFLASTSSTWSEKLHAYDRLGPNIYSSEYKNGRKDKKQDVEEMRYQYFRELWEANAPPSLGTCDQWLISKLVFSREEVYGFFKDTADVDLEAESDTESKSVKANSTRSNSERPSSNRVEDQGSKEWDWSPEIKNKISNSPYRRNRASARRAWRAFNGRTKMMKGLFNYEKAFRAYTRKFLEEFVKDNVQYAEIRPNFMQTNQIFEDTARSKIDNFGTMRLIIDEYEQFMKDIGDMTEDGQIIDNVGQNSQHRPALNGMKVIYCTPRSFKRDAVNKALDECIEMKKLWPQYIAGFDLVGEEAFAKPFPLEYFEAEFQAFQSRCKAEGLDIPFLFHCGETPDDLEGNLETALRLDSRRIGHGYALPEKPYVLDEMRRKDVCVETCPISNMVLGLAARMDQHSMYKLLDKEVHCAVSSDNGTLFKSTLSHDFYEVMAGHQQINLYGWKQLAIWSIEHSCLSTVERERTMIEWGKRWEDFITAITEASGPGVQTLSLDQLEGARKKASQIRLARLTHARDKAERRYNKSMLRQEALD
ncbi:hypothetical protein F5Y19DRAFT_473608 [Xylariaceae sp. FL1651]|nr:hypothetical protein F5Y19DRAFT_473608 [Xylariaceae sp. FL1651]